LWIDVCVLGYICISSYNYYHSTLSSILDDEIFDVAELLHGLLFPLQHGPVSSGIQVATQAQSAIFSMCERYWHGNFEDKEQLVTQLIPLLLMKCLDDNAQKNDVKRLYLIREAIDLFDFQDESIESVKLHLLRVVGNPLFLQGIEGRKFITHLFQVDTTLVIDLHRAVRAQIHGAEKSVLTAYADIYYNAWKASTDIKEEEEDRIGAIQQSIEENALQDFMYQVIHAAVPSTVKSVRVVLDKFYVNKKNPDVESMLHRMYGPLLWRALSGANSKIRIQASVVLTDTFPLRNPNASVESCVKKSVEALVSLMMDDVPSCRIAGCDATAKILSLFWSTIPSQDIRLLLDQIIGKHTFDASSSAVRAAAVNAVTTLLEEEKSHAVLRPLLSNVGNLIHDKTEEVRLAVVNMLLFVKRLRGIKYYHVVPADHLLSRLANEGPGTNPVAVGLSNLLSNSFFPPSQYVRLLLRGIKYYHVVPADHLILSRLAVSINTRIGRRRRSGLSVAVIISIVTLVCFSVCQEGTSCGTAVKTFASSATKVSRDISSFSRTTASYVFDNWPLDFKDSSSSDANKVEIVIESLESKVQEMKGEVNGLRQSEAVLKNQLNEVEKKLSNTEDENEQVKGNLFSALKEVERQQLVNQRLEAEKDKLEETIQGLQDTVTKYKAEVSQYHASLTSLGNDKKDIEAKMNKLEDIATTLEAKAVQYQATIVSLENDNQRLEAEVVQHQTKITSLRGDKRNLEVQVKEHQETIESLEVDNAKFEMGAVQYQAKIKSLEYDNQDLRAQVAQYQALLWTLGIPVLSLVVGFYYIRGNLLSGRFVSCI